MKFNYIIFINLNAKLEIKNPAKKKRFLWKRRLVEHWERTSRLGEEIKVKKWWIHIKFEKQVILIRRQKPKRFSLKSRNNRPGKPWWVHVLHMQQYCIQSSWMLEVLQTFVLWLLQNSSVLEKNLWMPHLQVRASSSSN